MAAKKKAAAKKAAPKKAAPKKAAAKKAPAKKAAPKKSKRTPNAAFMAPMTPSAELAAVIGPKPRPRTDVTKAVWDYIKKNKLQDAKAKRTINPDETLSKVFGTKKGVDMMKMPGLINKHLKK